MAKDTTKIVLIAGGAALIGYMLVNKGLAEKIQNALAGLGTGGGLGFGDISFPDFTLPNFNLAWPEIPGTNCNLSDLFGSNSNKGTGGGSSQLPPGGATVTDVVYTMPTWAKGVIGVSAGLVGGYGGYKVIQTSAPFLKALGLQAAKATGGIGGFFKNIFSKIPKTPSIGGMIPPGGGAYFSPVGVAMWGADVLSQSSFVNSIDASIKRSLGINPTGGMMADSPALGGSPATVAPSFITPPVATKTTALAFMPGITGNALAAIGWRQARAPIIPSGGGGGGSGQADVAM